MLVELNWSILMFKNFAPNLFFFNVWEILAETMHYINLNI